MKGPLDRTKIVLRHLPPTISQENLVEHIDSRFSGRYHWLLFRPGKSSQKHLKHSRAYIDFTGPDDVIEFAAFFNGHAFVNEKGTQFKAIVEYAPSQRAPKEWSKKDGREATIGKDPEYLEFLESISKPVENLPSAEIQLERKEAERAVGQKDVPIVTPLMEYVRQKRAAKRSTMNGKLGKRVSGLPSKNVSSGSMKKGPGSKRSGKMYLSRDGSKNVSRKLLPREDDRSPVRKSDRLAVSENKNVKGEIGGSRARIGEKKVLLKGKETESLPPLQTTATPSKVSRGSVPSKQNQRHDGGGKITRSIILKRGANQDQPALGSQSELDFQLSIHDTNQRASQLQKSSDGVPTEKVFSNDFNAVSEKHERRARNKDRPDRVVSTPLQPSDGSHATHDISSPLSTKSQVEDHEESVGREAKHEVLGARAGEYRPIRSRRGGRYSAENGSYRPGGHRSPVYSIKDADNSLINEAKPSKRGLSGYGSQEKQVWIQKSGSST